VGAGRDNCGDLDEVQVHRFGIAGRQDQGRTLALLWADGAEDVGRGGPLITGSAGAGTAVCTKNLNPDVMLMKLAKDRA